MIKLILVRHGYSVTNRDKKYTGQTDVPLDKIGLTQGKIVSDYIFKNYKVDKIYSSDLCRAVETIKPLADGLALPIETSPELRELYMGKWEGMYIEDVKTKDADAYLAYKEDSMNNKAGGGESFGDLMKRSGDAIKKIASENDGKTVVVASHGGFIRSLIRLWHSLGLIDEKYVKPIPNASITVVNYENGYCQPELVGYDDYFDEESGFKTIPLAY